MLLNSIKYQYSLIGLLVLVCCHGAMAVQPSQTAPDFTLKSYTGENLRLDEQRGQVVMINFWASWCGPCRQEMPLLQDIYNDYSPMGFNLLGVNVDENTRDAEKVIKALGLNFPILLDNSNTVSELFSVDAMPMTVILDRDGTVRHIHRGYKPGYEDDYIQQISQLIREE